MGLWILEQVLCLPVLTCQDTGSGTVRIYALASVSAPQTLGRELFWSSSQVILGLVISAVGILPCPTGWVSVSAITVLISTKFTEVDF